MRLTGKVALVTGCAQGIGAAICRRFVEEGAAVIAADSNEELGTALADELTSTGAVCTFHRLDVRSERDWTTAMDLTMQRHGRLDVLVTMQASTFRAISSKRHSTTGARLLASTWKACCWAPGWQSHQ